MPTMKKCPKCGGKHIAPILYGYPVFDEELEQKLDRQELVLGGCKITGCDPQFHCFDCGRDIGKPRSCSANTGRRTTGKSSRP